MKQQRGGTFLGFVFGLVVGLGVALGVAVYITKVPVPFVDKGLSRAPERDADEARKNKDWDPNAPLHGKNPAPRDTATPPSDATVTPPAVAGQSNPAPPPRTPSAAAQGTATAPSAASAATSAARPDAATTAKPAATASDPLGDLAKARATAPATAADPFDYFVQTGAFRAAEEAEGQRAKLAIQGIEAKVSEREQSGRTVFRVRVGPFARKDEAERLKGRLDGAGMESTLVRVQR